MYIISKVFPHFIDNRLTDGGEIISLTCRPAVLYPQEDSSYSFLLEADPGCNVEKIKYVAWNGTGDLPACVVVLRASALMLL
jgi:hypothetical protein